MWLQPAATKFSSHVEAEKNKHTPRSVRDETQRTSGGVETDARAQAAKPSAVRRGDYGPMDLRIQARPAAAVKRGRLQTSGCLWRGSEPDETRACGAPASERELWGETVERLSETYRERERATGRVLAKGVGNA